MELPGSHRATGLVDVLDRILDKGLVIAGDIKVSLAEVELLTIRIRLLVCSLDKAQEIGLDWWRTTATCRRAPRRPRWGEQEDLRAEIRQLQQRVEALTVAQGPKRARARRRR